MAVTRREDVAALAALAIERFGRLDVFIANAGTMPIGPIDDLAINDWEAMVDVNVKGVLWSIAAATPIFRRQGAGHFIAIASTAARNAAEISNVTALRRSGSLMVMTATWWST